ncbi:MAG: cytochrome c oxidase assembly protein, partial [Rhodospirillales bacterium]|nr:cytochrome c oxidase assembly protein [Rhodospirillales bacterium]
YASVPLYQWFCQATGFGGTTQVASATPNKILDREITVRFNSDVNSKLPWRFQPEQLSMKLKLGEERLAFYSATNQSDESITGTATFNVTPAKAGIYFNKIDCFCFTEQTLQPGQTVDMPVAFYVDPEIVNDRKLDDVSDIALSYTFFRAPNKDAKKVSGIPGGIRNTY